ncbi:hypothetical protein INT46_005369 [Mucor plumbeus]|uniref:Uncharacterized protein n=1 Tax=Mucor plumbeus TaxID=97098 RepID=A0A8H7R813_9FUNG|nr:hypothetical protein INT46_005369 [Mucor plumbeus]
MSVIQLEQDFPIGFAEDRNQLEDTTEFYVEWLDNNSEFPGLAASSLNNANLNGGNWELLQRKELNDEDNIVEEDEGAWSKINTSEQHPLYAQVAEKNAVELQPTKRRIQPLWPITSHTNINEKKQDAINEDDYNDDLGAELIDAHKAQSRRANRMTKLRNFHDLRTIDVHVEGVFRLATSHKGTTDVTWLPYDTSNQDLIISYQGNNLLNLNLNTKSQALRYSARFKHNVKKFSFKSAYSTSSGTKHPAFPDSGEYSVHSQITKRK